LLAGLLVAGIAYFAAAGVEDLWSAAVRRPFAAEDARFDPGTFLTAANDYLHGRPLIEQDGDKWKVVSLDGKVTFAEGVSEEDAKAIRNGVLSADPTRIGEHRTDPPSYVV